MQGPNVKKLILQKMARDAIPEGGGLMDGVRFLSSSKRIAQGVLAATAWVQQALAAVKSAPDNRWGDDDEAIAGEILRQVQAKKGFK